MSAIRRFDGFRPPSFLLFGFETTTEQRNLQFDLVMVPCIISNLIFCPPLLSTGMRNRPPTNQQYVWSTIPLVVKLIEQSSGLAPILVIRSTVPPGTTLKWEAEVRAKTDKPFQARTKKSLLSGLVSLVANYRMMAQKVYLACFHAVCRKCDTELPGKDARLRSEDFHAAG